MANPIYESIVDIMSEPPEKRQISDIEKLLPWFRKKSDLFKKLETQIVVDIVKNCLFTSCARDAVIIRQGEKGDCFYIMLSGTVAIHVNTTYSDEDVELIKHKQMVNEEEASKGHLLDRNLYGNYVGKIDSGKSFGELALINPDCIRNASIIANETVDLLVIDRSLYNRSLHAFQAREVNERKQFVENFPLFTNWQTKYKKQMAFSLRKETVRFEQMIVKQGQQVDGLVFLMSGQARLTVEPAQHSVQYPEYYPLTDIQDLEREEAIENFRREMNMKTDRNKSNQEKRFGPPKKTQADMKLPRQIQLCTVGGVEIIGDLEMSMGLSTYNASVECAEEGSVFVLNQKNYDRLVDKRNPQTIEMLREIVHTKLTLRVYRFPDGYVPLLRYFLYKLDERERKLKLEEEEKNMAKVSVVNKEPDQFCRGPLIDMYGPGSVFYIIRKREKAKLRRQQWNKSHRTSPQAIPSALRFVSMAKQQSNPSAAQNTVLMNGFNIVKNEVDVTTGNDAPVGIYPVCSREQTSDKSDTDDEGHITECSEVGLSRLENRIRAWHQSFTEAKSKTSFNSIKLHRFSPEQDKKQPLPGSKILLRKRQKRVITDEELESPRDESKNISHISSRRCLSAGAPNTRTESIGPEKEVSSSTRTSNFRPVFKIGKRAESARQYSKEDYEALKEKLRLKQKSFKSILSNRPKTAI